MLLLDSLLRLVSFYSGNATLQLLRLETGTVAKSPNMKTFSQGGINAPMFLGFKTSMQDLNFHYQDDLNTTMERLFYQQVEKSTCDIQYLKFGDHLPLEEIWLGVVPIPSDHSFKNLKSLFVVECEYLPNVIPFYLLPFLCNLEEIHVINCKSIKAIFDVQDMRVDMKLPSQHSLPLKKLILSQLPNLEYIWNLMSDEFLSLQSLQEVYIYSCEKLKSLFPTSVANHLVMLDVRDCARLVEILVENEAALKGETKQFIFHCLISITLRKLPELKYFYNGKHSLEWPMLAYLDIYHCDKLKLFTSEHNSGEVADIEDQVGISNHQQAIFIVEKIFPNIEQLSLKKEDAMAISHGLFQAKVIPELEHQAITTEDTMIMRRQFGANAAHLLQNLKLLTLLCYHEDDESNIFSSGLLEKIPNIENLRVACSSFNEIFPSLKPSAGCTKIVSNLKGLYLDFLLKLSSIGLEHLWVEPLLKTLETLSVRGCPCLKILVPSNVSFSNLVYLNVYSCHGLDCQAIQEIVSKEGVPESNDDEIIITFRQLNALCIESLPSIVGFHM
uniref:Disease resistance protein At4g27190-like leucine-rich repeats domain-containing protein n=2 Tax=Glycine subgen. Soja TaxID=1462606 RepID=K7K2D2_SOYBN